MSSYPGRLSSRMIYGGTPEGERLTVCQNGKIVSQLAAFNPITGEAIQYMFPSANAIESLIFRLYCNLYGDVPTKHYFLRDFTVTVDEN